MNDTTAADTTALLDSLKFSAKDSLSFITQIPFYSGSYFIPGRKLLFMDYRYTADFLEAFPFTLLLDKGFVGQRSEVLVYGAGFNSVSYFQDGILINDRSLNSADLNHIQSEAVDSIEIIPAPRGFLYGPLNNPVSVNFLTKDFIGRVPYSRIKYYEGPFGEAMFDGIFSSMLFRDLNFFADITNRKTDDDEGFENSGFSIWQASARLKYLFSGNLNLSGSYNFVHSETGVNGGVDADSISRITQNIDSLLYNEIEAPVVYPNGLQKIKQHHFNLRTFWNPLKNLKSDLNLYYKFFLDETENIESINTNTKSKVSGLSLKETYNTGIFSSQINFNYEHHDFNISERYRVDSVIVPMQISRDRNTFSASPIVSLSPLDSNLILSVFYKFTKNSFVSLHGGGFDLLFKINPDYQFYLGYSGFELYSNLSMQTIEAGARYSNRNIFLDLRFYNRDFPDGLFLNPQITYGNHDITGIGIGAEFLFWKIQLESYMNIPSEKNYYNQFQLRGGIFYRDVLFDSSLALKTGFNFSQFERHGLIGNFPAETGTKKPRIDFTLAGEIQGSAVVYFAWENLLEEEYYIVPFYPMPGRSIRFGIAWEIFN